MMIPPRFLDEIRSRVTLSQVVGKKVKLTRAGREFKACCPFHREKSPSFTVSDDKQFFHCFGCGAHGDVIGFVMRHENLSFVEAVEILAAEAGLQMPRPDPESVKKAERARDMHALMEDAARFFEEKLEAADNVFKYLQDRGLKTETIHAFRAGFAPEDRQALRRHLLAKKYTDAQMMEAGLIKKGEKGEPYAFFRERVMFPVADRRGRIIAFGGRILPDHMRAPSRGDFVPPKYINSIETPLFDKGRCLYAESVARQAARDGQPIILTEGYMDVIACWQAGFRGAVAPMGTALTEEQILSLWSMIVAEEKIPVLCFDGDNAGRKAAARACERILPLLKANHSCRIAFMPEGQDPDSLIKAGGAGAFKAVLDSAMPLFEFLWLSVTAGRDFATPETRAGVVKSINEEVSKIADGEVQRHYQALAREKISEKFFRKFGNKGQQPTERKTSFRPKSPAFRDIHKRILLAAVLNHPHIFGETEEILGHLHFADRGTEALRNAVISELSAAALDRTMLHDHLTAAGHEQEVNDILNESVYVHAGFARPGADPAMVGARWMELWRDIHERAADGEIREGWRAAFAAGSEEEEEKLRAMAKIKGREGAA